jgi:protoporphyrinogen oxidase
MTPEQSITPEPSPEKRVIIIGAGPAGLTAAYELSKLNQPSLVLEERDKVGGLSRTENYKGYHFDMGGHRFFTKSEEVKKVWRDVLRADFLQRPRLSRIYYQKKFFYYPLKPLNALAGLGIFESILIGLSYLWWQLFPYRQEETFEQWVTNRFGKRLFLTFFKTYTEKVWGIPCSELKAEWAAQRIKDLSLKTALLSMFFKSKKTIKTLIEEFDYPRLGPGMMWNAVKAHIESQGAKVQLGSEAVKFYRNGNGIERIAVSCNGHQEILQADHVISSMPLTELVKRLDPPPPPEVLTAVKNIVYRDFLTVCLIVNKRELFPDNWIYIHDPDVKVGRIQNFKNWSPDMVPDQSKTSLGLEYFCKEGDSLWNQRDEDLIELGKREVERIGLAKYSDIEDGCVFRVPKSYPVYDSDYREHLGIVREFVESLGNFQTVGRNGLHRYNNQDHAMLTGILAVRNLVLGERNDLWSVNTDQDYHEEVRVAPEDAREITEVVRETLAGVFPKLDGVAFGCATGILCGLGLFLATLMLILKGGDVVGPRLQLLSQYYPGYSVTAGGTILGLAYGFVTGLIGGWSFAFLRNGFFFLYMAAKYRSAERMILRKLLDYF